MNKSNSSLRGINGDSFNKFQKMTIDAWDVGDDDVMQMMTNKALTKQPVSINRPIQSTKISSAPNLSNNFDKLFKKSTTIKFDNSYDTPKANNTIYISPKRQNLNSSSSHDAMRNDKFSQLLQSPNLILDELKKISWSGIPFIYRPVTWKLLSGYLPCSLDRRVNMLQLKRQEYYNYLNQYYNSTRNQMTNQDTHRQIEIDVPRMSPHVPLFQQAHVQEIFKRILYIWAIRHPASGYVQGMNDLVTPFFVVFLSEYLKPSTDAETVDLSTVDATELKQLEADCFWSYSKVLEGIQDNYTFAQPGIQVSINRLRDLISRIDNGLHRHLESHKVEYLQFTFRWMNNLLMRELPLRCILRLWDTYLSEPNGFASFHLYVCAAFLTRFSSQLKNEQDFQGLMSLLQNFPTQQWTDEDISLILADAYRLKYSFADAPKHLATPPSSSDNAPPSNDVSIRSGVKKR